MKNLLLIVTLAFLSLGLNAQTSENPWAMTGYLTSLQYLDSDFDFGEYGFDGINPGGKLMLSRALGSSLNANLGVGTSGIVYPYTTDAFFERSRLFYGDFTLAYKFNNGYIMDEDASVAPYIFAGIKAGSVKEQMNLNVPLGLGFKIAMSEYAHLVLESSYNYKLSSDSDIENPLVGDPISVPNFLHHGIGISYIFNKGEAKEMEEVVVEPDPIPLVEEEEEEIEEVEEEVDTDKDDDGTEDYADDCPDVAGPIYTDGCPDEDGDRIADKDDDCPTMKGTEANGGCPERQEDSDEDGIPDDMDKCPKVKGTEANNGCPDIKDADKDGIADDKDECPNAKGPKGTKGCPDKDGDGVVDKKDNCPDAKGSAAAKGCPDSDGDGVADDKDKCPEEAGVASNKGCPKVSDDVKAKLAFAAKAIQFESGSAVLKLTSKPNLDQVAKILGEYPKYNLKINGYTDSSGDDAKNLALSQKRARACQIYLEGKGVSPSRMTSAGFGEANPIADNATTAGRAVNRRVELDLFIK